MANNFIHGKSTAFLVGSTVFDVVEVDFSDEVEVAVVTHTGANGKQVVIPGVEKSDVTITFVYDTDNKPTVSPQQLSPGTVATLHQKPDGTDDFTASYLCHKFTWKGGPRAGEVLCTVEATSTGTITMPVA